MKPITLFQLIATALQVDTDIATHCVTEYGREQVVYDALSGEFPPGPESCPFLLVHSPSKSASRENRSITHSLNIDFFIYDTDDEDRADDAQISSGTERLLTLMDLSRQAIITAAPETVIGYDQTTNTVDLWPLMVGSMTFDFIEPVTIGMDPLA